MANLTDRRTTVLLVSGLIVLYILSVIINLGYFNLQGEEPRRAIIAIEMLESGDYIVPHALGWQYYNKPPLYNWILSGFISLTGSDSEFVLRLPSLIFFFDLGGVSLPGLQKMVFQGAFVAFHFFYADKC